MNKCEHKTKRPYRLGLFATWPDCNKQKLQRHRTWKTRQESSNTRLKKQVMEDLMIAHDLKLYCAILYTIVLNVDCSYYMEFKMDQRTLVFYSRSDKTYRRFSGRSLIRLNQAHMVSNPVSIINCLRMETEISAWWHISWTVSWARPTHVGRSPWQFKAVWRFIHQYRL